MSAKPKKPIDPLHVVKKVQGLTLQRAYLPKRKSHWEADLQQHQCFCCGQPVSPDGKAQRYQRDQIVFEVAQMSCDCGYQNMVYVVLNDCLRQTGPGWLSSSEAMARAESMGMFDVDAIEAGLVAVLVSVVRKQIVSALQLASQLSHQYPQVPEVWYHKGWLLAAQNDFESAAEDLSIATTLNPDFADAWYHLSFAQLQIGQFDAARESLEQYQMVVPDHVADPLPAATILDQKPCSFGQVRIIEGKNFYRLLLGDQVQGGALRQPSAQIVDPQLSPGPGPVPESLYTCTWLVAAANQPRGNMLMLGLGSGIGPVSLLYNFPKIRVVAVDIDAGVIEMARKHFPLLDYYVDRGRLQLVCEDAFEYLKNSNQNFHSVMTDLFCGPNNNIPQLAEPQFHAQVAALGADIWMNLIGIKGGEALRIVAEAMKQANATMSWVFPAAGETAQAAIHTNWVMTNARLDWEALKAFKPYRELSGYGPDLARSNYAFLLKTATQSIS